MAIAAEGKLLIIMTLIEYCALHSPGVLNLNPAKGGHIIHYKLPIDHKHLEANVWQRCTGDRSVAMSQRALYLDMKRAVMKFAGFAGSRVVLTQSPAPETIQA